MADSDEMTSADGEAALDSLLAQWAGSRRLTAENSQAIRRRLSQAIDPPRPELHYAWWQQLFQHCGNPIPRSARAFLTPFASNRRQNVPL